MKRNKAPIFALALGIGLLGLGCRIAWSEAAQSQGVSQNEDSISPEEALRRGKEADKRKDYDEAEKMYELSAEGGDAEGQYNQAAKLFAAVVAGDLGGIWVTQGNAKEKWDKEVEDDREKGLDWLQKSAAQGYAPAELELGKLYAGKGKGEFYETFDLDRDLDKAKQWLEKAAAQGNGEAKDILSDLNSGITPDKRIDFSDLNPQAAPGTTPSAFSTPSASVFPSTPTPGSDGSQDFVAQGWAAQQAGKMDEAFSDYKKAVATGSAKAEEMMGWCYWCGNGVSKDPGQARQWFQKAADQGEAGAEYGVGCGYYYGLGQRTDYAQALEWFQKSADQGDASGEYGMGECYYNGQGVSQDFGEAVKWLQKSADQGNSYGEELLGWCYWCGNGVPKDFGKAADWFKKSANQGEAGGEYGAGCGYYYGLGRGVDYAQALQWFQKSADQGNAEGEFGVGECYFYGQGTAKDGAQALVWFQKSSGQGNADGQYGMGLCYQFGAGVTVSLDSARTWFQMADNQGDAQAKTALAELASWNTSTASASGGAPSNSSPDSNPTAEQAIQNGDYYSQANSGHLDEDKAREWYVYAAKMGNAEAEYKLGLWYDALCNPLLMEPENPQYNCPQAVYWFQQAADQGNQDAADEVQKYHQSGWR